MLRHNVFSKLNGEDNSPHKDITNNGANVSCNSGERDTKNYLNNTTASYLVNKYIIKLY